MTALQLFDPDDLPALDPIDERAADLLARARIGRASDAGEIFLFLYRQAGGGPGTCVGIDRAALRSASGASDGGVRKWLAKLQATGLIRVHDREDRFAPLTIDVCLATEDPQRRLPGCESPAAADRRALRLVTSPQADDQTTQESGAHLEVRTSNNRCAPGHSTRCAPQTTGAHLDICDGDSRQAPEKNSPPEVNEETKFTLADELLEPMPGETTAQQLRRVRARIKPQTLQTSSCNQTQTSNPQTPDRSSTPKDQGARPGAPLAGTMAEVAAVLLGSPASIDERTAKLVGDVRAMIPDPDGTLSLEILDDACNRAMSGVGLDVEPFTEGHVRRFARKARLKTSPPAYFHECVFRAFKKRGWPWPYGVNRPTRSKRPREPP